MSFVVGDKVVLGDTEETLILDETELMQSVPDDKWVKPSCNANDSRVDIKSTSTFCKSDFAEFWEVD